MNKIMLSAFMALSIIGCKPVDPPVPPPATYHSQDLQQCNSQPELTWCKAACENKEIKGTFAWCLVR